MTSHPAAPPKPVMLLILDGWGLSDDREANAVAQAKTPHYDRMMASRPTATLKTCGEDVGLPPGQMGNSEVGHMNLGAGRVVWMDLPKIDNAIADGSFATRPAWAPFLAKLKETGGAAHVLGLMSPGGVHAHHRHIAVAARAIAESGAPVRLHLFTDGRDTAPKSALDALADFEAQLGDAPNIAVASVSGRYFAMDRDHRWERVAQAWRAIAQGDASGAPAVASARAAIEAAYAAGATDEFVSPRVVDGYAGVVEGDALFMANFRADRAREILEALLDPDFAEFDRNDAAIPAAALGMVSYSDAIDRFAPALFPAEAIEDTLGAVAARLGLRQFRAAETEKYPHVTFFFNGGVEPPAPGEDRHLEPSPKVATYDLQPEMAALAVTEALVGAIRSEKYDLIIANYANPDMVGHTGDLPAAVKAVETVDAGLGAVIEAIEAVGGGLVVTADHGNCELMIDPATGEPHTAHTLNPVPIALIAPRPHASALREGGRLADVAPTLLALLGRAAPAAMTGRSLLRGAASGPSDDGDPAA